MLLQGINAKNKILELLNKCIEEKKQACRQNKTYVDVFSTLMNFPNDDDQLSEQELKEAALELLFAGHETTASAACAILVHLARTPHVVEKMCTELSQFDLMSENATDDLDLEIINKLKYTNMVTKEILRITPPIGGGFRKALKTFDIEVNSNNYQKVHFA